MNALNAHVIELHSSIRRGQRERVQVLAANRAIAKTGTVAELMTVGLVHFLTKRPYQEKNWHWVRPEAYYQYKGNIEKQQADGTIKTVRNRLPNGDWLPWHPEIVDLEVAGKVLSSSDLLERLKAVAALAPKSRVSDTGVSCTIHSMLVWMLNELYPLSPAEIDSTRKFPSLGGSADFFKLLEGQGDE